MSDKRRVGDDVLADLDVLLNSGAMTPAAPAARSYSTPTKLGHEMLQGAGPTIARQKATIEQLEAERAGGMVVLRIDPRKIRASAYANRHERSLAADDASLLALKLDIQRRGQLDPIRVRPLPQQAGVAPAAGRAPPEGIEYEIVYGHRRHAVCLSLNAETPAGFPVLALLDTDAAEAREHVLRMHSENFARSDLSPFEYGRMYASWLATKCFKSQDEIAAAVGLDQSMISTYVRIARLPAQVLAAFGDPRTISVRWSRDLAAALKEAEAQVLATAAEIAARDVTPSPPAVLRELVEAARPSGRKSTKTETIKVGGKNLFKLTHSGDRLSLTFGSLVSSKLATEARNELKEHLGRWLTTRVKS